MQERGLDEPAAFEIIQQSAMRGRTRMRDIAQQILKGEFVAEAANDQRPLVLLDAVAGFRAFFALPTDIATSEGLVTNALHGFAAMLLSLVRSQNPGVGRRLRPLGGTFRDVMVEDYKGDGRDAAGDRAPVRTHPQPL